jgi:hypothetical protein
MAEDAALAAALKAYADALGDDQSTSLTAAMPQLPLHLTNDLAPSQISMEDQASMTLMERLQHPPLLPIDIAREGVTVASHQLQHTMPMNELLVQELMLSGGQFSDEAQQLLNMLEEQQRQQQKQHFTPPLFAEESRSEKHYFTIALDGTLEFNFLKRLWTVSQSLFYFCDKRKCIGGDKDTHRFCSGSPAHDFGIRYSV